MSAAESQLMATSPCQLCTAPALSLPGPMLGQMWGKEVGGLSCATGLLDSPVPSSPVCLAAG